MRKLVFLVVSILALITFSFMCNAQTYTKPPVVPVNEAMATAAAQVVLNPSQSAQIFSNAGSGSYAVQYVLPLMPFTINGSITSGMFVSGETITQASTSATATVLGSAWATGTIVVAKTGPGADATHIWTGGISGATFTPTSLPLINSLLAGVKFDFLVTDTSSAMKITPGYGVSFALNGDYRDSGVCTMAAGVCTAQNLSVTYTSAPSCYATWTGTGRLSGILSAPSVANTAPTVSTVTPTSSITTVGEIAVINYVCHGIQTAVVAGHSLKAPAVSGSRLRVVCKLNTAGTAYIWDAWPIGPGFWIDNGS